jgi:hypothetical protein
VTAGRVVLVVLGCLVSLVGLAALAGGVALLVADHTQRDSDGFFSSASERYRSGGYALVSDRLDVGTDGPDWVFEHGRLATLRVRGSNTSPRRLFIGIAPTKRVDRYLAGTSYDTVTDIDLEPFSLRYRPVTGTSAPRPPGATNIWAAAASGVGRQTLEWKVAKGDWSVVVMNADASRNVDTSISLGAKIRFVLWLGLGVLLFGLLVLAGGAALIYAGARRRRVVAESPAFSQG